MRGASARRLASRGPVKDLGSGDATAVPAAESAAVPAWVPADTAVWLPAAASVWLPAAATARATRPRTARPMGTSPRIRHLVVIRSRGRLDAAGCCGPGSASSAPQSSPSRSSPRSRCSGRWPRTGSATPTTRRRRTAPSRQSRARNCRCTCASGTTLVTRTETHVFNRTSTSTSMTHVDGGFDAIVSGAPAVSVGSAVSFTYTNDETQGTYWPVAPSRIKAAGSIPVGMMVSFVVGLVLGIVGVILFIVWLVSLRRNRQPDTADVFTTAELLATEPTTALGRAIGRVDHGRDCGPSPVAEQRRPRRQLLRRQVARRARPSPRPSRSRRPRVRRRARARPMDEPDRRRRASQACRHAIGRAVNCRTPQ